MKAQIREGKMNGAELRIAIVVGRFNSSITDKLLEGAVKALKRARVDFDYVEVIRVPGSFEIPVAALLLAQTGRFDAVVCLGAIIKGDTPHWSYLSQVVTTGISHAALETGIPMTNAVLTTETYEDAAKRACEQGHNKGYDAALAAVEMANLCCDIKSSGNSS